MKKTSFVATILSSLLLTSPALAEGLSFVEAEKDGQGADGLLGASALAISPDGLNLYAVAERDDAVSVFSRDPLTGLLTYREMEKDNVAGVDGLNAPTSIHVAGGGNHLYTGSTAENAVAIFSRDAGNQGRLTFVGDVRNGDYLGCTGGAAVQGLTSVRAVTSDLGGLFVYAAGYSADSIVVFQRDAWTGELCYVETEKSGVGGVTGLDGVWGLAVSPDGGHLYAASNVDDSVAVFSIDPLTGELTFLTRYKDSVGGVTGLNGARSVTVSWDGSSVYVGGYVADSIAVFNRNPSTGLLTFVTSYKDGVGGVDGLNGVHSVTMGTYDDHLYAASYADDAVAVFARDPATGLLTFEQALKDGAAGGDDLGGAEGIAAAWDGGHVYAASRIDHAVSGFEVVPWIHKASARAGGPIEEADIAWWGKELHLRSAVDSGGNTLVAGTFSGSMTVGAATLTSAGGTDAFVVKLSPAGAVLWSKRLGGAGNDTAAGITTDGAGSVIVTGELGGAGDLGGGTVTGVTYVAKLTSAGNHVWSKGYAPLYGDAVARPRDVAANAVGTIVLGGMQWGTMDFGGNVLSAGEYNPSPFVVVLGANGAWLWGRVGETQTSSELEAAHGVAIDASGNVAVTGDHRFGLSMGCSTTATTPYSDMFVMKLTPSGACSWSAVFGATDGLMFDRGRDVAFGAGGAVVAAGYLEGPGTIGGAAVPPGHFLVSLTSAGVVSWVRSLGWAQVAGIATDSAGDVLVAGHFTGTVHVGGGNLTSAGGADVFFARYSSANEHLWSARHGNSLDQYAGGASAAPGGDAVFVGSFQGTLSFGGASLTSTGASDAFVARYGAAVH